MPFFSFVDKVTELKAGDRVTAFFKLTGDEEFLQNHFEGFPVMPGVLLLESLKQAAGQLLNASGNDSNVLYQLAAVDEVKFGQFIRPGTQLRIQARLSKRDGQRAFFEGRIDSIEPDSVNPRKALVASFSLEPIDCAA